MTDVSWVHEDSLDSRAYPAGVPALFVFDDAWCAGYSLMRIGFIYECLLDMDVQIRRGDTLAELRRFAQENGAGRFLVASSPSPFVRQVVRGLREEHPVDEIVVEPFVRLASGADLKRFSRYWRKVEKQVLDVGR
jgi:hypothetical protein